MLVNAAKCFYSQALMTVNTSHHSLRYTIKTNPENN